mgnify:CR=1 FL=1
MSLVEMTLNTMAGTTRVPHLRLDPELVGARHSYDAWREMLRAVYDVNPLSDAVAGTESVSAWLVDSLIFTDVTFSKQSFHHNRRHARDANYLSLQIYRTGAARGTLEDADWIMSPGEVHLFDFSREFRSVNEESSVTGVVLPHHAIGYDPARHPPYMKFTRDSAAGRYLANALFSLIELLPDLPESESGALAEGFCGLLQGLLSPKSFTQQRVPVHRAQRREAIRSFLERNLSNPDLDVDHICRAFSLSRSSLYRDFAETGGVAQYVTARRLDRAYSQLLSATPLAGYVGEVAERCGFTDSGHFSRLFRKRFGVSPKMVMKSKAGNATTAGAKARSGGAPGVLRLNDWFQSI